MPTTRDMAGRSAAAPDLTARAVFTTWWPLAASWILMATELPLVSAFLARLAEPKISLAAYGGVVFPLSMMVEAPIIMLLSASTALSRDRRSFLLLRRFMLWTGGGLTVLHLLIALTPLYGVVVGGLIHAPAEILRPARIGLVIMFPWTFSIAYRRMHQGVAIRFGRPHLVGIGTVIRLGAEALVLTIGYLIGSIPGIVVGASAVAAGVVSEAVFAGLAVRPLCKGPLRAAAPVEPPLTFRTFLHFYVPLAMTPLLALLSGPIGSAGISRMPRALDSLAVWPVLNGLIFATRSVGLAFNEVVVALLDEPGARAALRRFALYLGIATTLLLLLIAGTPLARLYFARISALPEPLAALARQGIWIGLLLPALAVLQSWYQGMIVHSHRTRGITEAVGIFLVANFVVLAAGIRHGRMPGLFVALAATVIGGLIQIGWLRVRSRGAGAGAGGRAVVTAEPVAPAVEPS